MTDSIEFEDRISNKKKKISELTLFILGCILTAFISYFAFRMIFRQFIGLIIGIVIIIFVLIFFKKGSGIKYGSTFQIKDTGIFLVKSKSLFSWKDITKIELLKGSVNRFSGSRPTMAIVQGHKVNAIDINLNNNEFPKLQEIINSHGIEVEIK